MLLTSGLVPKFRTGLFINQSSPVWSQSYGPAWPVYSLVIHTHPSSHETTLHHITASRLSFSQHYHISLKTPLFATLSYCHGTSFTLTEGLDTSSYLPRYLSDRSHDLWTVYIAWPLWPFLVSFSLYATTVLSPKSHSSPRDTHHSLKTPLLQHYHTIQHYS